MAELDNEKTENTPQNGAQVKNPYAERIVFALNHGGYTKQKHYAAERNISDATVSTWCNPNGSPPGLDNMIALSNDTGISIEWLVKGTGPRMQAAANTPMDAPLLVDAFKMILEQAKELGIENDPLTILRLTIPLYHYGLDTQSLDPKMAKTLLETARMAM